MKQIFCNLKRFDVPVSLGGVNRGAAIGSWGSDIVCALQDELAVYGEKAGFTFFFPEAHLLPAVQARRAQAKLKIGCQGVFREDVTPGGNFGAFTSVRPAAAAKALGCDAVLVGHCEERRDKAGVLRAAGVTDAAPVDGILNREVQCALGQGLSVLFCVGETEEQHENWRDVLEGQLSRGLAGVQGKQVTIAYEPVWAIGPGKTPPGAGHIQEVARHLKAVSGGLPVVYGGGLKQDNAGMLAGIPEIDGGLIALTRFSGEIGFYPEEYLEIVTLYLEGAAWS